MHKVAAILISVKDKLTTLITSGTIKELHPSSVQPPEKYPCVIYGMGQDAVENRMAPNIVDMRLTVNTYIIVSSTDVDLDSKTIALRGEIEKAMLADYTLGLPFVFDVKFSGQDSPEYFGSAETYNASLRLSFDVYYRTNPQNPFI